MVRRGLGVEIGFLALYSKGLSHMALYAANLGKLSLVLLTIYGLVVTVALLLRLYQGALD